MAPSRFVRTALRTAAVGALLTPTLLVSGQPALAATDDTGLCGVSDPTFDGVFRQSLGLLGYAAHDEEPPSETVTWLLGQQCASGGWQAYRPDTADPCAAPDPVAFTGPETNSTALAVQALSALVDGDLLEAEVGADATAALDDAVEFLTEAQNDDAGWSFIPGADSEANSTGVVVSALYATGLDPQQDPYRRDDDQTGLDFLVGTQTGCEGVPADRGGLQFFGSANLLATVQAVPALSAQSLPVLPQDVADGESTITCPAAVEQSSTDQPESEQSESEQPESAAPDRAVASVEPSPTGSTETSATANPTATVTPSASTSPSTTGTPSTTASPTPSPTGSAPTTRQRQQVSLVSDEDLAEAADFAAGFVARRVVDDGELEGAVLGDSGDPGTVSDEAYAALALVAAGQGAEALDKVLDRLLSPSRVDDVLDADTADRSPGEIGLVLQAQAAGNRTEAGLTDSLLVGLCETARELPEDACESADAEPEPTQTASPAPSPAPSPSPSPTDDPGGELPNTGADTALIALLGAVLLVGGGLTLVVARVKASR